MGNKNNPYFSRKLKSFLHDPIDKCFDIPTHEGRAEKYAEALGIRNVRGAKGLDWIDSCMERNLLPGGVIQGFNEIRHPLWEGKIEIEVRDKENIFQKMQIIFSELGKEFSSIDDRWKFFYLYRNLQDFIFSRIQKEDWAKYLPLLPADTRIPDHSMWEHLKIASAIDALRDEENKLLYQNNSLFLFTIGPVQSFISQARKTQDFYMGSFILSFLTFKAMEEVIDKYGPTNIIYPDLYKQPLMDWWIKKNLDFKPSGLDENSLQIPTIPNRFIAIIPTTDKNEIKELAEGMIKKIKNLVKKEIKEKILKELDIHIRGETESKIISQLSEFPEIFWVAVPWKIDNKDVDFDDLKDYFEEDEIKKYRNFWDFASKKGEYTPNIGLLYGLLYTITEKSMGARKNIRKFYQPAVEERGRKCSVCGERDVIFFRESKNEKKFTRFFESDKSQQDIPLVDLTDSQKVSVKFLADGEGLCAICFIKRAFNIYLEEISDIFKDLSFPSTAEVACADFKYKALENAKEEYFNYHNEVKNILKEKLPQSSPLPKMKHLFDENKINVDGQLFFEENLREKYFEKEFGVPLGAEDVDNLKKELKAITNKIGKPNSYYALIYLDGDNMGKWLSGELLPGIENAYNTETWENLPSDFKEDLMKILSNEEHLLKKHPKKPLTPAIHAAISSALRNYAIEFVRKIVEEEHLGKLIYAGGDDVLALVNLRDLLDVMQKLRWAFSGEVNLENGEIEVDLENKTGFVKMDGRYLLTMGPKATASIGVVIAHYKTPLKIVIDKVFDMEKEAKKDEKDSFAICLMRRSGEERVAKAKWKCEKDTVEILKSLKRAFDENEELTISKGFIKKVASEFERLKNEEGNFPATGSIFDYEVLRLLNRSYQGPKGKKKEFIEFIWDDMKNLFWMIGRNIDNFVNFCIIATFLNKGED